jgi:hypothetical protein
MAHGFHTQRTHRLLRAHQERPIYESQRRSGLRGGGRHLRGGSQARQGKQSKDCSCC